MKIYLAINGGRIRMRSLAYYLAHREELLEKGIIYKEKIRLRERSHKFLVESAKIFELYRKGSEA